jgi:hypothetical protein
LVKWLKKSERGFPFRFLRTVFFNFLIFQFFNFLIFQFFNLDFSEKLFNAFLCLCPLNKQIDECRPT